MNDVGTQLTAYYSYLPPGEYVFNVSAANRDGQWNDQGASIAVKVLPPFYKTSWFVFIVLLGIFAVAASIYYLRVRQLKMEAARQEDFTRRLIASQEAERGRIAAEMHDGLGQSLAIIKNRAILSLSKPSDQDHALEQLHEIADASTLPPCSERIPPKVFLSRYRFSISSASSHLTVRSCSFRASHSFLSQPMSFFNAAK